MSFFDKFKANAFGSLLETFAPNLADLAPQAKEGIINLIREEEAKIGANVICIASLSEDKTDLYFGMYFQNVSGELVKFKDIDLSDPKKLIDLLLNQKQNAATNTETISGNQLPQASADTANNTTGPGADAEQPNA